MLAAAVQTNDGSSTMADNDAARANFEELKGHIDLASKRIRALQPGEEKYAQSLEDLEDYYERTVQLRRIQADTAIEERDEAKRSAARKVAAMTAALIAMAAALAAQFAWLAPEAAAETWSAARPYATWDRIAMLAMLAAAAWTLQK